MEEVSIIDSKPSYGFFLLPEVNSFLDVCGLKWGCVIIAVLSLPVCYLMMFYYLRRYKDLVYRRFFERFCAVIACALTVVFAGLSVFLLILALTKCIVCCTIYIWLIYLLMVVCVIMMLLVTIDRLRNKQFKMNALLNAVFMLILFAILFYITIVVNSYKITIQLDLPDDDVIQKFSP